MDPTVRQRQADTLDLGKYDQVVAVSEYAINEAFNHMWEDAAPDSLMRVFEYVNNDNPDKPQAVKARLGPPSVKLQGQSGKTQLYFYQSFLEGSVVLTTSPGTAQEERGVFPLGGATIAFKCEFEDEELDRDSQQAFSVKHKLGFTDAAFSIFRIYVKSSLVQEPYDDSRSTIPDKIKQSQEARIAFKTFVDRLKIARADERSNLVGYRMKDQKITGMISAEFVPTSLDYSIYPWLDDPDDEGSNDNPKNALCMLSMLNNRRRPRGAGLEWSGPIVETGAALLLAFNLFWDKWLLPLARSINHDVELVPLEPPLETPSDPHYLHTTGPNYTFGNYSAVSDPRYDWKLSTADDVHSWEWDGGLLKKEVDKVINKVQGITSQNFRTTSKISYGVNKPTVTLHGDSHYEWKHFHPKANNGSAEAAFKLCWEITFEILATQEGGLHVSEPTQKIDFQNEVSKTTLRWNIDWESWQESIRNNMKAKLKDSLDHFRKGLDDHIKDQHRLVLPGAGQFHMIEPRFSKAGDLIVDLRYNNFSSPVVKDPALADQRMVTSRLVVPAGKFVLPDHVHAPDAFRVVPNDHKGLPCRGECKVQQNFQLPHPIMPTFSIPVAA